MSRQCSASFTGTNSVLLHLSALLLLPAVLSAVAQETCYFPGRAEAPGFKPCGSLSSTTARACCNPGEPCLSNGLCFSPTIGAVYRGACTDPNFSDAGCPNVFTTNHENSTANMNHCYGIPALQVDNNSCSDPDIFQWNGATIIPYAGSPPAQSSSEPSALPSSSSSSVPASSPTPSATNSSADPASAAAQCSTPTSTVNTAALGVGLGIGLPLAALAAVFTFLWLGERRKRHEAERIAADMRPMVWAPQREMGPGYGGPQEDKYGGAHEKPVPPAPVNELSDRERTTGIPELGGR